MREMIKRNRGIINTLDMQCCSLTTFLYHLFLSMSKVPVHTCKVGHPKWSTLHMHGDSMLQMCLAFKVESEKVIICSAMQCGLWENGTAKLIP